MGEELHRDPGSGHSVHIVLQIKYCVAIKRKVLQKRTQKLRRSRQRVPEKTFWHFFQQFQILSYNDLTSFSVLVQSDIPARRISYQLLVLNPWVYPIAVPLQHVTRLVETEQRTPHSNHEQVNQVLQLNECKVQAAKLGNRRSGTQTIQVDKQCCQAEQ